MAKQDANWIEIDPETLEAGQAEAYATYKAQYRAMKAAREAFEASMQVGIAPGERVICGYNFGKLSVAVVADERKPAKAQPKSLTQYLAERKAAGLGS